MKNRIITIIGIITGLSCSINGYTQDAAATKTDDFKPSGNVYGYLFGDYYMKSHADSLNRGGGNVQYRGVPKNFDAFQIRRAYLGYDFNISKQFSTSVLLADEAGPSITNTGTNLDASGSNSMYVKFAYVKWSNIFKNSSLILGQYVTSSFATANQTEMLMGYRFDERTLLDMHGNDQASDLGLSLQGNVWTQQQAKDTLKPTLLGYVAQVGNGSSAKPETDKFKKVRVNLFLSTMQQRVIIGIYGDYNPLKLNHSNFKHEDQSTSTMKLYAHYKSEWFKIGAEIFQQTNMNGDIIAKNSAGNRDTVNGMQQGISVFASGRLINHTLNIFVRLDMYNPDSKFNASNSYTATAAGTIAPASASNGNMTYTTFYKQTFYTIGLDYTPIARVHIMPNIWYDKYTAMMSSAGGKTLTANQKSGYDLVPRITCYFIFNSSKTVNNNGMDY